MTFEWLVLSLLLLVALYMGRRWWVRKHWVCPGKVGTIRCQRLNPECVYPKCLRPRAKA